jgi:plasmid replication initiation protein
MMKIEDFKAYFQVPKSYKMGNIDQIILNPAIEELNSKTNIKCSISKRKKGRNITHINFKFEEE